MSRYVIPCTNSCCPEIEFPPDGNLCLRDDYEGVVTIDRPSFEAWYRQECVERRDPTDPEEFLKLEHETGILLVRRRELQALYKLYDENKAQHPLELSHA